MTEQEQATFWRVRAEHLESELRLYGKILTNDPYVGQVGKSLTRAADFHQERVAEVMGNQEKRAG